MGNNRTVTSEQPQTQISIRRAESDQSNSVSSQLGISHEEIFKAFHAYFKFKDAGMGKLLSYNLCIQEEFMTREIRDWLCIVGMEVLNDMISENTKVRK